MDGGPIVEIATPQRFFDRPETDRAKTSSRRSWPTDLYEYPSSSTLRRKAMRRFRLLGATLVVAALVATGCSDSDDEGTVTGGGGGQTNTTSGAATLPAGAGVADHSTCQG